MKKMITTLLVLACAGLITSAHAGGRDGHIPSINPGSGPSGRTLPAMPTPTYGQPSGISTTSIQITVPSARPAATMTPAYSNGKMNSNALGRLPSPR